MQWSRILDIAHTCFVLAAIYEYFIKHIGLIANVDLIPWYAATAYVTVKLI